MRTVHYYRLPEMRKLLIILFALSGIGLSACSSGNRIALPKIDLPKLGLPDWKLPGVHHIQVRQGNLITQKMVNELKPGMTKRQVRFLLGTPLLIDTFHENRWDYIYTNRPSGRSFKAETEQQRLQLLFKNNRLNKILGDMYPQSETLARATREDSRERTVIVPADAPRNKEDAGFIKSLWKKVRGQYSEITKKKQPSEKPEDAKSESTTKN